MGSQKIQGELWGRNPKDWVSFQEPTGEDGYEFVLQFLKLTSANKLLDVGCGAGLFSELASKKGADVTAIDASENLLEEAKKRNSSGHFFTGEMEELPFADSSFDIVCGFNSFQYAANIKNALTEARRVLKDKGKLVTMIWGSKEDCEAASYLKAVGSLLPPPPPGSGGPFALSENNLLEKILIETGFTIIDKKDVVSVWDYPDAEIALKGLLSAGPAAKAIDNSGFDKAYATVKEAMSPHTQQNGHVVYKNKWRIVISEK